MRKLLLLLLTAALISSQTTLASKVIAPAEAAGGENTIVLNTQSPNALVDTRHVPNWDTDVLDPLRAQQAADAAAKKAAARKARSVRKPVIVPGTDAFALIRQCEAGGDYTRNSGNGYYGAYQYNLSTWANYGGYARPDLAPPAVQDAKAHETQAARGWSPWPACSLKLGLR